MQKKQHFSPIYSDCFVSTEFQQDSGEPVIIIWWHKYYDCLTCNILSYEIHISLCNLIYELFYLLSKKGAICWWTWYFSSCMRDPRYSLGRNQHF